MNTHEPDPDTIGLWRENPTEDLVRSLSEAHEEPQWMTEFRLNSLTLYRDLPEPDDAAGPGDLSVARSDTSSTETFSPDTERSSTTTSHQQERIQSYRNRGVLFLPLHEAIQTHPERVRTHFMQQAVRPDHNKYTALHGALWNGGTFVYVPEDIQVDLPLTVYHRHSESGTHFPHQLIVAEPGSSVRFFEGCSAPPDSASRTVVGCVEAIVGRNASVQYSTLQNRGPQTMNVTEKRAVVDRNGSMEWVAGNLGSRFSRVLPATELLESGARCRHLDFSLACRHRTLHGGAEVLHRAPNTSSTLDVRSASVHGGHASTSVRVTVQPESQNATSRLQQNGLLLDRNSRISSQQNLDLRENEVSIQQQGTTRDVSTDRLFYQQTRGIRRDHARRMQLEGFLRPILDGFPPEYAVELQKQIGDIL